MLPGIVGHRHFSHQAIALNRSSPQAKDLRIAIPMAEGRGRGLTYWSSDQGGNHAGTYGVPMRAHTDFSDGQIDWVSRPSPLKKPSLNILTGNSIQPIYTPLIGAIGLFFRFNGAWTDGNHSHLLQGVASTAELFFQSATSLSLWGKPNVVSLSTNVFDGRFHHLLQSFDSNGVFRVYVDGRQEALSALTPMAAESYITRLGTNSAGAAMSGQLCDIRVYDRVLTARDVRELVRNPQELYKLSPGKFALPPSASSGDGYVSDWFGV